jgi:hypothetical protein
VRPEQLDRAVELQRKGWTHERISRDLGIARETVSRALSKHNRRVLARLVKRTEEEKACQLQRLEWAIEQASEAWERSKEDAESITETTKTGLKAGSESSTKIEGQCGDPRLLKEFRGALADIRKILGLDQVEAAERPFSLPDLVAAAEAAAAAHRAAERPTATEHP